MNAKIKIEKEILEYLGIEEELITCPINQKAIAEAKLIEEKYFNELNTGKYHYGFYGDIPRFYDKNNETINIIEDFECVSVFEIKPKENFKRTKSLKINGVINIDKFDEDYICWLEVTNIPKIFIKQAKLIDGKNYNSTCFGICIVKDNECEEKWNVITESFIGQLFYIDDYGTKHWMRYNLNDNEETQAIEFCKNYIQINKI